MKPEDLRTDTIYLWTWPNGTEVEVRFIGHLPPQSPILDNANHYPGIADLNPRCEIEEIKTSRREQIWLHDLREMPD